MSKGELEKNIFICNIRLTGAKRCFPGVWEIALLEIQKKYYLENLYNV